MWIDIRQPNLREFKRTYCGPMTTNVPSWPPCYKTVRSHFKYANYFYSGIREILLTIDPVVSDIVEH